MADNTRRYGIRWFGSLTGGVQPKFLKVPLASAVSFDINGGTTGNNLSPGDPLKMLSTGYWGLSGGYENGSNNADKVDGIVANILPFYDSSLGRMRPGTVLPSSVTYGTNFERQTFVEVIPTPGQIFEIDADAATFTTMATYIDIFGNNADHTLVGLAASNQLNPQLHMAVGLGTSTAVWRILGLSPTQENQDLTGLYVKLLVTVNECNLPPFTTTGT
jgi:hypothetical protein